MRIPRLALVASLVLTGFGLLACQPSDDDAVPETADTPRGAATDVSIAEVIARDFVFEAPAEIPSGWTTLRLTNEGAQEHFVVLWKMPEGLGVDDYIAEVAPAFGAMWEPYQAGEIDRNEALQIIGSNLPEWYGIVEAAGGVGLTSPGGVSETVVNLAPGTYVMECYVKTPDAVFHSALGMLQEIVVSRDPSGAPTPIADVAITISNYAIDIDGELSAGPHTISITATQDPEGLLKHDLHLVRLAPDGNLEDVIAWTDWMDALTAPGPAVFLGGSEDLPADRRAYVNVELTPGRYAWVSESYGALGVAQEFVVE